VILSASAPRWSILIATQPSRATYLRRLLAVLAPQVLLDPSVKGLVKIVVRTSDPILGLGDNRQIMREEAQGVYSNFVDDDDLVAPDYVAQIVTLLDGVDYVSYDFQEYADGVPRPPTHVSLHHGPWHQDKTGLWRDIVHFCPIKTALALAAPMEGGYGEDQRWTDKMRALGIVKTEHHIDAPIHFLYFRSRKADGAKCMAPGRKITAVQEAPVQREAPRPASLEHGTEMLPCPQCGIAGLLIPANGGLHCNQCGSNF
jgi:hypothetical protein